MLAMLSKSLISRVCCLRAQTVAHHTLQCSSLYYRSQACASSPGVP